MKSIAFPIGGHDFRPDYRRIVSVLRRVPANVPVLGTTATANDRVINDIQAQFSDFGIQRGPLIRESLALQTISLPTQAERLAWLAQRVPEFPGTGVIYTLTRRDADIVSKWLNCKGIKARPYYSDVKSDRRGETDADYRKRLEKMLLANEVKALVATVALGMGFDKPDLGFVVHYQAPGSVVAYYQQVGRAGRAIDSALGVMLSGREDDDIHEYFRRAAFPTSESVELILDALAKTDGLSTYELQSVVNLPRKAINHVLTSLSVENPSPIVKIGSKWRRTPVPYKLDLDHIARLTRQREAEWHEVQEYLNHSGCLMQYLAEALNDPYASKCGKCEACLGRPIVNPSFSHQLGIEATRFLRLSEFPLKCRVQIFRGAFTHYQLGPGNLPQNLRACEGRVLSRWRDAGWGNLVADGKSLGKFSNELVEASVDMLRKRWRPSPYPAWITCVPSLTQPKLVSDFTARLANALGLPFRPVVEKVKQNQPQKQQENSFHQSKNLDGVFRVVGPVPKGPVLLVDDVVDSTWTLTVAAALLRQANSGPVYPFALASSTQGG